MKIVGCDLPGAPWSRAFRDLGTPPLLEPGHSTKAPHPPNCEFCNNYSVISTLLCLFYHTSPLALSMTWEVGKGINSD